MKLLLLLLSLVVLSNCAVDFSFLGRQRCYAPTHLPGPRCRAGFIRFTFDQQKGCTPFIYGGCNPSPNNFETLEECRETCEIMPIYNRLFNSYGYGA